MQATRPLSVALDLPTLCLLNRNARRLTKSFNSFITIKPSERFTDNRKNQRISKTGLLPAEIPWNTIVFASFGDTGKLRWVDNMAEADYVIAGDVDRGVGVGTDGLDEANKAPIGPTGLLVAELNLGIVGERKILDALTLARQERARQDGSCCSCRSDMPWCEPNSQVPRQPCVKVSRP